MVRGFYDDGQRDQRGGVALARAGGAARCPDRAQKNPRPGARARAGGLSQAAPQLALGPQPASQACTFSTHQQTKPRPTPTLPHTHPTPPHLTQPAQYPMSLKYTPSIVQKIRPRSSVLIPFLERESPAALLSEVPPAFTPFSLSTPNPFLPTKSPNARSWTAPKYSARRQKALRREVAALGLSQDILPPGPAPRPASVAAAHRLTSSAHIRGSAVLDAVGLAKVGPYSGRKGQAFKGKMWERKFEARQDELRRLLAGAEAKEAAWRKVSRRSSLGRKRMDEGRQDRVKPAEKAQVWVGGGLRRGLTRTRWCSFPGPGGREGQGQERLALLELATLASFFFVFH